MEIDRLAVPQLERTGAYQQEQFGISVAGSIPTIIRSCKSAAIDPLELDVHHVVSGRGIINTSAHPDWCGNRIVAICDLRVGWGWWLSQRAGAGRQRQGLQFGRLLAAWALQPVRVLCPWWVNTRILDSSLKRRQKPQKGLASEEFSPEREARIQAYRKALHAGRSPVQVAHCSIKDILPEGHPTLP